MQLIKAKTALPRFATKAVTIGAISTMLAGQLFCAPGCSAKDSKAPRSLGNTANQYAQGTYMEPKNVPDFARTAGLNIRGEGEKDDNAASPTQPVHNTPGTPLQAEASSSTLPVQTRMRLVLETPVDAKLSKPGDIFEAHVADDLTLGTSLILPRGSLVRGRVVEVSRPKLISRAGKIALKLEQIDTPQGEVIPLDAALQFRKGTTNQKGQLDPGTNLGSRVHNDVRSVTGLNSEGTARGVLVTANIATLGAPAIATAIGSSVVGVFRSGDNVNMGPGQVLEVELTNDLGVQVN